MLSSIFSRFADTEPRLINWESELNNPQEPDDIKVKGLGIVKVTQQDIEDVKKYGSDIKAELVDISTDQDRMPVYRLGRFYPA